MIKNLILKYIGSNLDWIIAFLQELDTNIDKMVDNEATKQIELTDERMRIEKDLAESERKTQTALSLKSGLKGLTQNV